MQSQESKQLKPYLHSSGFPPLKEPILFPGDTVATLPPRSLPVEGYLKQDLENRRRRNPRTPLGLAGLLCCRARAEILGLTKSAFQRESGIARDTVAKLEAGESKPQVYLRVLRFLRQKALGLASREDALASRLEAYRTRIAKCLVADSIVKLPLNRLFLELYYRYGKGVFERNAEFNLLALKARDKKNGTGEAGRNFRALRGILREVIQEERRACGGEPFTVEQLWRRPEMRKMVAAEVEARIENSLTAALKRDPVGTRLNAFLLVCAAFRGKSNHDALQAEYGLSSESARALTRGESVSLEEVQKLFSSLLRDEILPESIASCFCKAYSDHIRRHLGRGERDLIAHDLHTGLKRAGLSMQQTAAVLGIDGHTPGYRLRRRIDDLALENKLLSFHALACLAGRSQEDAESLVKRVLEYSQGLPGNALKPFSEPKKVSLIHCLALETLPEQLRAEVSLALETGDAPSQATLKELRAIGEVKSVAALKSWIELFEPSTVINAMNSFDRLCSNSKPHLQKLKMSQATLRKYQAGNSLPGLLRLKQLLRECGAVPSKRLIVDWYGKVADDLAERHAPFGRALHSILLASAGDATAFYRSNMKKQAQVSLGHFSHLVSNCSYDQAFRAEPYHTERDRRLSGLLAEAGIGREIEDFETRFGAWRASIQKAGMADPLLSALKRFGEEGSPLFCRPKIESLEFAFQEKQRLSRLRLKPNPQILLALHQEPELKVLSMLPGVTLAELRLAARQL